MKPKRARERVEETCPLFSCTLFLLLSFPALAYQKGNPPRMLWWKTFGGIRSDEASAAIETKDGDLVIAGSTKSFGPGKAKVYLLKVSSSGKLLWERTFGEEGDGACCVVETKDGGLVVAGGAVYDHAYLVKVSSSGKLIWEKSFGDSDRGGEATGLIETQDGLLLIAGRFSSRLYLVKLSHTGDILWEKTFKGEDFVDSNTTEDCLNLEGHIIEARDGGLVIAGSIGCIGDVPVRNILVFKLTAAGKLIWKRVFDFNGEGDDEAAYDLVETQEGDFIIVGEEAVRREKADFGDSPIHKVLVLKISHLGEIIWEKVYGEENYRATSIAETDEGAFVVAATSWLGHAYLLKATSSGNLLWVKAIGGKRDDRARAVVQTADGGILVAGSTTSFGAGDSDVYLFKLAPEKTTQQELSSRAGKMVPQSILGISEDRAWILWESPNKVKEGDKLALLDGEKVVGQMEVVAAEGKNIQAKLKEGGPLKTSYKVVLAGEPLNAPKLAKGGSSSGKETKFNKKPQPGTDENKAMEYYSQGDTYFDQEKFVEAAREYTKALEMDPKDEGLIFDEEKGEQVYIQYGLKDTEILLSRALAYYKMEEYDKAISDAAKAIALHPGKATPYLLKGFAYFGKEDYGLAIDDYEKALGIDPENATAHYSLGTAYWKGHQRREAISHWAKAYQLGSEKEPPQIKLVLTDGSVATGRIIRILDSGNARTYLLRKSDGVEVKIKGSRIKDFLTQSQYIEKTTDCNKEKLELLHAADELAEVLWKFREFKQKLYEAAGYGPRQFEYWVREYKSWVETEGNQMLSQKVSIFRELIDSFPSFCGNPNLYLMETGRWKKISEASGK